MNKIGPGGQFDPRYVKLTSAGLHANTSPSIDAHNNHNAVPPIATILARAVPLLPVQSLEGAKQAWADLANITVQQCFKTEDGHITIDRSRVEEIIKFWQENTNPPAGFENVPSWTLVRTQTLSVLTVVKADMDKVTAEDIVGMTQYGKGDSLVEILMRASTKIPYSDFTVNGYQMLESMSSSWPGPGPMGAHEAILASLLTPHRQCGLPSCPLDALINQETCNNPAALAKIFLQLLESEPPAMITWSVDGMIHFSNRPIISSGPDDSRKHYIIISPKLNWANLADIYEIKRDNAVDLNNLTNEEKISIIEEIPRSQCEMFETEGIEVQPYIVGEPQTSTLWLKYPIHNLTDVFFANMMQYACEEGNMTTKTNTLHRDYYDAIPGPARILYRAPIARKDAGFDAFGYEVSIAQLQSLKGVARELRAADPNKHLAAICTYVDGTDCFHVENLYLENLAEVPIDGSDPYYIIGDRNYTDDEGKSSFLAVRRAEWNEDRWEFIEVTEPDQTESLLLRKINFEP